MKQSFFEWCNEIELRYDRLPHWYKDTGRRLTAYREYEQRYDEAHPQLAIEQSISKGELDGS
jgi:hypothetical protein|tara:strand:+ start:262 stop:447 length:186 start_codon:yes stop_codon:yes gene_type:complete